MGQIACPGSDQKIENLELNNYSTIQIENNHKQVDIKHVDNIQKTDLHYPLPDFADPFQNQLEIHEMAFEKIKKDGTFVYPQYYHLPSGTMIQQTFLLKNGIRYNGQWKCGKVHGKGIFLLQDGSVLQATTNQNIVNGMGRLISKNGDWFQGQIKNNKADGYGKCKEGDILYQGYFENNVPHGEGKETGPQFTFTGLFSKGKRVKGKLIWTDENGRQKYDGSFINDLFDGEGEYSTSRQIHRGIFKEGQLIEEFHTKEVYSLAQF